MAPRPHPLTPSDIADTIRDLLYEHKMNARDLAVALLSPRATVSQKRNKLRLVRRWISPTKPTTPNKASAQALADYFGVKVEAFLLPSARNGTGPVTALEQGLADLREQLGALQARVRKLEAGRAAPGPRAGQR